MTFEKIIHDKDLLQAIADLGFTDPTDIQEQTIPLTLEGKDVIGQAKTGSGKTLAFSAPILHGLSPEKQVQALVICPTRELSVQVTKEMKRISARKRARIASVYGGVGLQPQIHALQTAQIVVGTPGRLLDHLGRGTLDLSRLRFLVLDEADRMLDMGFIDDIQKIIDHTPGERQTLLFSATMPDEIKRLAVKYMTDPSHVRTSTHVKEELLPQFFYVVPGRKKFSLLVHLINEERPDKGLIFCATRRTVDYVSRNLEKQGVKAASIHGGLSQAKRESILEQFRRGKVHVLIATDLAARGLHIQDITHVFNYDVPKEAENYIHRIGRTARAGKAGKAITLLEDRDYQHFQKVLDITHTEPKQLETPDVKQVGFSTGQRRESRGRPPARRFSKGGSPQNTAEQRRKRRQRRRRRANF